MGNKEFLVIIGFVMFLLAVALIIGQPEIEKKYKIRIEIINKD